MATKGHGTTLSGASTGEIAQITNLGGMNLEADDIDTSTMASTNAFKEHMAGMIEAGEITMQLFYEKANSNTIIGAVGGTAETWTVTFPDSSTFACSGYIKSHGLEAPHDGAITAPAAIKLTGEPTFSPAA